jgi:hypothetical protein
VNPLTHLEGQGKERERREKGEGKERERRGKGEGKERERIRN